MPKIIINNRRPNENSKKFFEDDNISKQNQTILLRYLDSFEGPGNKRSAATIRNNTNMMMYSLKHIKTDLDKLTEDDIDDYKRAIGSRTRKDGTPIAKSSTKYFVAFKQFLRWCGKKYKNPENAFLTC